MSFFTADFVPVREASSGASFGQLQRATPSLKGKKLPPKIDTHEPNLEAAEFVNPYASDAQRGFMHVQHPEIAAKWDKKIHAHHVATGRDPKGSPVGYEPPAKESGPPGEARGGAGKWVGGDARTPGRNKGGGGAKGAKHSKEALNYAQTGGSATKVPGPYDDKTLSADTCSPNTDHKDEVTDYPRNMTDGGEAEGDADKELQEKKLGKKVRVKSETLPGGRFPMPDKNHARLAISMLPKAHGLTPEDKAKIKVRAKSILGHATPTTKVKEGGAGSGHWAHKRDEGSIRAFALHLATQDLTPKKYTEFADAVREQFPNSSALGNADLMKQCWADYQAGCATPARESVRESLVFHPQLIEGKYDPATRTADVIIIAEGLGNKRDKHYYGADTLKDAVSSMVFEGAQAYADHPSNFEETDRPERSVRDLFGYYFGTQVTTYKGKAAISAKLRIQEGQDWAVGLIKEAIEYNKKFPDKVYAGISINADGDVSPSMLNGQEVNYVHKITNAFSADLVTKPARGGKFLALVESASGARSNSKGVSMDKKLQEAATRLRAQIATGEVEKDDLAVLLEGITADAAAHKGVFGEAVKHAADCECAECKECKEAKAPQAGMEEAGLANFGGKQAKPFGKGDGSDDGVTDAKEAEVDGGDKQDGADGDNDEDDDKDGDKFDVEIKSGGKSAGDAQESKTRESDVRAKYPSIFAAALREAKASVAADTKATIETLKTKVAELSAANAMRESIDFVQSKLKESSLPEAAAVRLMPMLVGKSAEEITNMIEAEANFLAEIGVTKTGKKVAGNVERTVSVRESEDTSNTSVFTAGCK
jgi:hypothetical protein